MNPLDEAVGSYIEILRNSRKPEIGLVLEVLREAFAGFSINTRLVMDGVETGMWMWEDVDMADNLLPKFYVLTTSNSPGLEGYPIVTIRQAYSLKLDTWVTVSSIVPVPDRDGISRSLAMLLAQHAGAFAGIRYALRACAENGGHPHAGLLAVRDLMQSNPPIYGDVDEVVAEKLEGTSDKEMN